jgi:SAM-dependent methyltransferase
MIFFYIVYMNSNLHDKINWDSALSNGPSSYDSDVSNWWNFQSTNSAHIRAYTHIAKYTKQYYVGNNLPMPKVIVDYACGNGLLIQKLAIQFPQAIIIGLDGSKIMLYHAEQMLQKFRGGARLCSIKKAFALPPECSGTSDDSALSSSLSQIRLAACSFPNFILPKHQADLVFLNFPNLIHDAHNLTVYDKHGYCNPQDAKVGRMLARFREMDPEDEVKLDAPEDLYDELMTARVYSNNLRHLLKPGGILARTEYSNAPVPQLTDLTRWKIAFAECSLDIPIKNHLARQFFKLRRTTYKKSDVIQDVFHQTGDPGDAEGGYYLNLLEAL